MINNPPARLTPSHSRALSLSLSLSLSLWVRVSTEPKEIRLSGKNSNYPTQSPLHVPLVLTSAPRDLHTGTIKMSKRAASS